MAYQHQPDVPLQTGSGLIWALDPSGQHYVQVQLGEVLQAGQFVPTSSFQQELSNPNSYQDPNLTMVSPQEVVPQNQNQQSGGIFESLLYHDQQSFLAELEAQHAAQPQQYMPYQQQQWYVPQYQEMTTMGGQQQQLYNIPNQNQQVYAAAPMQPSLPQPDAFKPNQFYAGYGPKSDILPNPGPNPITTNNGASACLPPPPPAPSNKLFKNLRILFEKDSNPPALECLNAIVVKELKDLGEAISVLAILLPIEEILPGVYNLVFHFNIMNLFQSRFQLSVTADYPAEAPVVNFDVGFMVVPAFVNKIKHHMSKVPLSFRVKDVVKEWARFCLGAYKAKMVRLKQSLK